MTERIRAWSLISVTGLLLSAGTSTALAQSNQGISFNVSLRGTGSATIHAEVYDNPAGEHGQLSILAVHGLAERGSMFQPLAAAVFSDNELTNRVRRIIAIDLPAHGLSSVPTLPSPLQFGNLLIEDNASVVIQAIDILNAQGLGPQWIMGHSMGGLTVQLVQEMLLAQGSSLAQHGVSQATLISAVPARGTAWTRFPSPDLTPFIQHDPVLGTILALPTAACGNTGAFTTLSGTLVPNTPTPQMCVANDWMSIEPITTVAELVGTFCQGNPDDPNSTGLCRPFVRQNAFSRANATKLMVLSFSQDVLTPFVDQAGLYTYLTGIASDQGPTLYRPTVAADAVHSTYIADPAEVVSAIRNGTP